MVIYVCVCCRSPVSPPAETAARLLGELNPSVRPQYLREHVGTYLASAPAFPGSFSLVIISDAVAYTDARRAAAMCEDAGVFYVVVRHAGAAVVAVRVGGPPVVRTAHGVMREAAREDLRVLAGGPDGLFFGASAAGTDGTAAGTVGTVGTVGTAGTVCTAAAADVDDADVDDARTNDAFGSGPKRPWVALLADAVRWWRAQGLPFECGLHFLCLPYRTCKTGGFFMAIDLN
jgi:hypothetical protein